MAMLELDQVPDPQRLVAGWFGPAFSRSKNLRTLRDGTVLCGNRLNVGWTECGMGHKLDLWDSKDPQNFNLHFCFHLKKTREKTKKEIGC